MSTVIEERVCVPGLPSWVFWECGGDAVGTSLAGIVECSYADLVAVFGEPNHVGDSYKCDAGWLLTFDKFDGLYRAPATIYNYKDGKNYLGDEGKAIEDITSWHIGARKEDGGEVVGFVASMLIAHLRKGIELLRKWLREEVTRG